MAVLTASKARCTQVIRLTMNKNLKKKLLIVAGTALAVLVVVCVWGFYVPVSLGSQKTILFQATSGLGNAEIAADLNNQGIISNKMFFQLYAFVSGSASRLQAGLYDISPDMSVAAIVRKIASGDVATNKVTFIEGQTADDLANYLAGKHIYTKAEFNLAIQRDYSKEFAFLKGKPQNVSLEGFLYPDTYYVPVGISAEDFVRMMLNNFNKKLTPDLRRQIAANKKSIFQVVTMASIVEKEVPSSTDKKIVAGILWKRIAGGMPLQVDATVNYATGKHDASVTLADTKIDSSYNTYKYYGLPPGPISNPGLDSILAAINPTTTPYWFWFSANGRTFYSQTYGEHSASVDKYLN